MTRIIFSVETRIEVGLNSYSIFGTDEDTHGLCHIFSSYKYPSTASSLDAAYIASGKDMSMESVSNAVPALPPTPPPTSGNENGEFM